MLVRLLDSIHGRRAAWLGGLLLATDTTFLLTTCFDWGPVVLQHFLLVSSLIALLNFVRLGTKTALFWGCFLLGLGVWDKVLFLWILGGLAVAVLTVFPRELWMRLTFRNAALAAAGFCLGALLLTYNAASGSQRSVPMHLLVGRILSRRPCCSATPGTDDCCLPC